MVKTARKVTQAQKVMLAKMVLKENPEVLELKEDKDLKVIPGNKVQKDKMVRTQTIQRFFVYF